MVENLPAGLAITSLAYSTLASLCSRIPGEAEAWEFYADLALRHAPTDAPEVQAMARCQKARALMHQDRHREEWLEQTSAGDSPIDDRTLGTAPRLSQPPLRHTTCLYLLSQEEFLPETSDTVIDLDTLDPGRRHAAGPSRSSVASMGGGNDVSRFGEDAGTDIITV